MKSCSQCLYDTTHPHGLVVGEDGICSGCTTHKEKFELDWGKRQQLLVEQISKGLRRRTRKTYDCVVPLRGTPEYFVLLDILVRELGVKVLGLTVSSHFNTEVGINNLARMSEVFDIDIISLYPNPVSYKKLVRESMLQLGSLRWPFLAHETVFPVRTAVEMGIPFVVWPYHQSTEQVGTHSYVEEIEMSRLSRHSFDLMGIEPNQLLDSRTLISDLDIEDLEYPSDRALLRSGVRGVYVANYVPWDSRVYSEQAVNKLGALSCRTYRTFDTYDRIDDSVYMSIHDLMKQQKLGYSRVLDSLCREIRFGRVSRSDALAINEYFSSLVPALEIERFAKWIGTSIDAIQWLLGVQRFDKGQETSSPLARAPLGQDFLTESQINFVSGFVANYRDVYEQESYILSGKGIKLEEEWFVRGLPFSGN